MSTATLESEPTAQRRADVSVARALGSSTRAEIYGHLQRVGAALTVRDVADAFDLHPNVARTHLETLADAGLVVVGRRKHPGGGRPAKLYLARAEAAAEEGAAAQPGEGAAQAAALLVRLLATLLDDPARGTGQALVARAHELAAAEGRRLAAAVTSEPAEGDLEAATEAAVRALRPYAPEARIQRAGEGWVDLAGLRGTFRLLGGARPEIATALERGLVIGALAGAGAPVTLVDGGAAGAETCWRARLAGAATSRAPADPTDSIDTRGQARERGVVQAMRAITPLHRSEVLEVLTEGPGSPAAFARWADRAGHQLLGVERAVDDGGRPAIRLLIRKGAQR